MTRRTVEHATCLGCGCACDDIAVVVDGDRIAEARNSCPLGRAWFADGSVPRETRSSGKTVAPDVALADAAKLLGRAERPLVYLAPDISCETQRAAVAVADRLGALLDSPTAEVAAGILASQRRGRAGATLGEIRQRADLVVFWGVDPADRYPRYASRYAVDPTGLHHHPDRAEALIALAQALNGPARCALSSLRAGGNRSGADAVATWQTGFPFAVDFAPGYPCYRPHAGAAVLLGRGEIDVALLVGSPAGVPPAVAAALGQVTTIAIGPRVSAAPFRPKVAIDTGVAGIHEGGIAFRMDDVPLPPRPALPGPSVAAGRGGRPAPARAARSRARSRRDTATRGSATRPRWKRRSPRSPRATLTASSTTRRSSMPACSRCSATTTTCCVRSRPARPPAPATTRPGCSPPRAGTRSRS